MALTTSPSSSKPLMFNFDKESKPDIVNPYLFTILEIISKNTGRVLVLTFGAT